MLSLISRSLDNYLAFCISQAVFMNLLTRFKLIQTGLKIVSYICHLILLTLGSIRLVLLRFYQCLRFCSTAKNNSMSVSMGESCSQAANWLTSITQPTIRSRGAEEAERTQKVLSAFYGLLLAENYVKM